MSDIAKMDACYAAGLFDGEGCVQLYMGNPASRGRNCFKTYLSISGVDLRPLDWLVERYNGGITLYEGDSRSLSDGSRRRTLGTWAVGGSDAEQFAHVILPFVLVKREQLDLWLVARSMLRVKGFQQNGGLAEDEVAERRAMVAHMKELKRVV